MFVQVIRGRTSDPAGLLGQAQTWRQELMPGAVGFLGGTAGVADDGRFVNVVRFETEDAARANAARPEQDAFWRSGEALMSDVSFHESEDIDLLLGGGSDDAGFVQAMFYRPSDRARLVELEETLLPSLQTARPDLIGSVRAWFADGSCCDLAYFTDEATARQAEQQEPPAEMQEMFALWGDVDFVDLRRPVLFAP